MKIMLFKYLIEIKNRILLLFTTFVSTVFVLYLNKEVLLFMLVKARPEDLKSSYFIFTDVTEFLAIYLSLIFLVSTQITTVFFFYHLLIFLSPAFFAKEYVYFKSSLKFLLMFWVFSIVLSNSFIVPLSWKFFLSFQENNLVSVFFEAKIIDYVNFYITLYKMSLIYCLCIAILLFVFSFSTSKDFKKFRKIYYLMFVVLSTLISPPDILSQLFLSFIFIVFYELFFVKILIRKPIKTDKYS